MRLFAFALLAAVVQSARITQKSTVVADIQKNGHVHCSGKMDGVRGWEMKRQGNKCAYKHPKDGWDGKSCSICPDFVEEGCPEAKKLC